MILKMILNFTSTRDTEMKADALAPPSAPPANTREGLCCVVPGRRVTVHEVNGADALAKRLHDLGFWPGAHVEVLLRAPWHDPTLFRLHGYDIALRSDEAARIQVTAVS